MANDKPLIMVVDDEPMVAESVVEIVKTTDRYEIISANSGLDAFKLINKNKKLMGLSGNKIKLIFLDLKMPDMSGLEFLQKLRLDYSPSDIGVIILSAWEDDEKWKKSRDGSVAGYILKPFGEEELLKSIDYFFSGKSSWMVEQTKWKLMGKEEGLGA